MKKMYLILAATMMMAVVTGATAQDVIVMNDAEETRVNDMIYTMCNSVASVDGTLEEETAKPVIAPSIVEYGNFRQQVSVQRYTGTIRDYPDLYKWYRSGKSMTTAGKTLLITGGALMAGGLAVTFAAVEEDDDELVSAGAGVLLLGTVAFTVGIPLTIVGSIQRGRASKAYRRAIAETQPQATPHLQLNVYGNGVGLAFAF
jgi:hypothetical protein